MKKAIVVMVCMGMSQAIGSSESAGWECASMSRQSPSSWKTYAPYEKHYEDFEGYQKPGFWNNNHRASAEDLAEGTDALLEGIKSLVTGLWNFMTK